QPPTIGKEANRERENIFYNNIIELRRNIPLKVAIGDQVTMVEWLMDFTQKEWGVVLLHQVAVQVWE
ncbi:MAG: nuclear transport factor 2 family protein, partial [Bacteroidota bacterium]